eukprot:747762-Hanusia_phi.AAC.1
MWLTQRLLIFTFPVRKSPRPPACSVECTEPASDPGLDVRPHIAVRDVAAVYALHEHLRGQALPAPSRSTPSRSCAL